MKNPWNNLTVKHQVFASETSPHSAILGLAEHIFSSADGIEGFVLLTLGEAYRVVRLAARLGKANVSCTSQPAAFYNLSKEMRE